MLREIADSIFIHRTTPDTQHIKNALSDISKEPQQKEARNLELTMAAIGSVVMPDLTSVSMGTTFQGYSHLLCPECSSAGCTRGKLHSVC